MKTFFLLWLGQVVSMIGSGMTGFSAAVWVYQQSHSTTALSLAALAATLPGILVPPLAGPLVDLWERRTVMVVCDCMAAAGTLFLIVLLRGSGLELWHVCFANAVTATFSSISRLAQGGSVALLVPEREYGKANGLASVGFSAVPILSPLLAGMLLAATRFGTVLLVDFSTYLFALATLAFVRIPRPDKVPAGGRSALFGNLTHGWRVIARSRPLAVLCGLFACFNFIVAAVSILLQPLVLSFSTVRVLGSLFSLGGIGALAGSLLVVAWGGPRNRLRGLFAGLLVCGLCIFLGGLRASVPWVGTVLFLFYFFSPIVGSSNQSLWQSRVPPGEQGRVFGTRDFLMSWTYPLGQIVAGRLAESVFEPLLARGGAAAGTLGRLLGVGPGRGIGLFFVLLGALFLTVTLLARRSPAMRDLESPRPEALLAPTA